MDDEASLIGQFLAFIVLLCGLAAIAYLAPMLAWVVSGK
jgi:hypothetical protein